MVTGEVLVWQDKLDGCIYVYEIRVSIP